MLKQPSYQISARLQIALYEKAIERIKKENISLNELINQALREYLSKNGEK